MVIITEDLTYAPEDVVRIFDAGPEFGDRYTVFFEGDGPQCIAMGTTPLAPNGFCLHIEADINIMEQKHAEVEYKGLPADVQTAIKNELCCWYTCASCGGYLDWSAEDAEGNCSIVWGDLRYQSIHADCPPKATS